jgi:hypothetical protein
MKTIVLVLIAMLWCTTPSFGADLYIEGNYESKKPLGVVVVRPLPKNRYYVEIHTEANDARWMCEVSGEGKIQGNNLVVTVDDEGKDTIIIGINKNSLTVTSDGTINDIEGGYCGMGGYTTGEYTKK